MTSYYNENDPHAAAWLRALIARELIPAGHVDDRSICDVSPSDLDGYTQCHFFAGIGGWAYALKLADWPDDRPVWTGSCPCQPFSIIGKKSGTDDPRHLWPVFHKLISKCNPSIVFGEQVASPDGRQWLAGVRVDLEAVGYAVGCADLCAAGVGAPHIRQRLYWVGNTIKPRLEGHAGHGDGIKESRRLNSKSVRPVAKAGEALRLSTSVDAMPVLRGMDLHDPRGACTRLRLSTDRGVDDRPLWSRFQQLACRDGWRRVEPGTLPLAHGVSARVVRLRGYGNAIVPQVAAEFIQAFIDSQGVLDFGNAGGGK